MTPTETFIIDIVVIIIVCIVAWFCYTQGKEDGYRHGQIDATNGEIKYKLIEFKDGERKYYKESELKDLIEQDYKIIK